MNKYMNESGLTGPTGSGALNPCHHVVFSIFEELRTFLIYEVQGVWM